MMFEHESIVSSRNSARFMRLVPNQFKTIGTRVCGGVRCFFVLDDISAFLQSDCEVLLEAKTNLDFVNPILSLPA